MCGRKVPTLEVFQDLFWELQQPQSLADSRWALPQSRRHLLLAEVVRRERLGIVNLAVRRGIGTNLRDGNEAVSAVGSMTASGCGMRGGGDSSSPMSARNSVRHLAPRSPSLAEDVLTANTNDKSQADAAGTPRALGEPITGFSRGDRQARKELRPPLPHFPLAVLGELCGLRARMPLSVS
jgi:hypothetical protein